MATFLPKLSHAAAARVRELSASSPSKREAIFVGARIPEGSRPLDKAVLAFTVRSAPSRSRTVHLEFHLPSLTGEARGSPVQLLFCCLS